MKTEEIQDWVYTLWAASIGFIHLGHWIYNFLIECREENMGMKERKEPVWGLILMILGFGVLIGVSVIVSFSWFDVSWSQITADFWFDYVAWVGCVLAVIDSFAFLYVHISLGKSWSGTVNLKDDHNLVVSGCYKFARHPMYAVLGLAPLITLLITGNGVLSVAWIIGLAYPISRFRREERLMISEFGQEYVDFMADVGPFWPCSCCHTPRRLRDEDKLLIQSNSV